MHKVIILGSGNIGFTVALLLKNSENLDSILENEMFTNGIPLEIQHIKTNINLEKYENKYDLNIIINGNDEDKTKLEEFFLKNGVDFDATFVRLNELHASRRRGGGAIRHEIYHVGRGAEVKSPFE